MTEQLRVLAVDDDPVSLSVVTTALSNVGYAVEAATNGDDAWTRLLEDPPHLLVTDWMMPGLDGPELIRRVRGSSLSSYVYIVLLTARNDSTARLEGLDAGADDYLTKPFDLRELQARARIGERVIRMERELRASRGRLRELATHEPVTRLFDQRAIAEHTEAELARIADYGGSLSIVLLRIEGLDTLDDSAPSDADSAPDDVLRAVAAAVRARLRPYEWGGRIDGSEPLPGVRWGADELLIVLPTRDAASADARADDLRSAAVASHPIFTQGERRPSLRVGVATTARGDISLSELRRRALVALSPASLDRPAQSAAAG